MSDSGATRNVGLVRLEMTEEALPDAADFREVPEPVLKAEPPQQLAGTHDHSHVPASAPVGDPGADAASEGAQFHADPGFQVAAPDAAEMHPHLAGTLPPNPADAGQPAPETATEARVAGASSDLARELPEPRAAGSLLIGRSQTSENALSSILIQAVPRGRKQGEMPNQVGIEVSDLVLRYPVGAARRGSVKSGLLRIFGHRDAKAQIDYVTAIRGVSFKVECGERVGIIGRNGSGKSSLLRVLAGVFPVDSGSVRIYGEIGTLLDIGLGFEAESTGRENIYNRGFAMGRSRKELQAAEAEIVAQAELGEFIDLPMRTYSSGMFVRLGFAVSTQFTPQVLLVDEVFGAGDAVFAKRAKARIRHLTANAGILMLVSHDFAAVLDTCTRVIWMDRGQIIADGDPQEVVSNYLNAAASAHGTGRE